MSSEHFPLRPPWHWHDAFGRKDGKGEPIACGPDSLHGEVPMGQCSHFSFAVSDDAGFVIAKCSNSLVTMSSDLSESHAKLLAAAPELLQAARLALEWSNDGTPESEMSAIELEFRALAKIAIAKTGL